MIRKMVFTGAVILGVFAAPAAAQDSSPPSILPTTITAPEPAPPATSPPPTVGGVSLPRTGGDIDAEIMLGATLTAAGLILAVAARRRRHAYSVTTTGA